MMRLWDAIRKRFPKVELLAALAVAGWFYARRNGVFAVLQQAGHLRHALFADKQVTDDAHRRRMEACRKCPLWFEPLSTCGTPLQGKSFFYVHTEGDANSTDPYERCPITFAMQHGCWCHMPTKAKTEENCWLYDFNKGSMPTGSGWPEDLNSFPYEHENQERTRQN